MAGQEKTERGRDLEDFGTKNAGQMFASRRQAVLARIAGPERGLDLISALLARGELATYHLAHSARADLLRRLERTSEAITAYATALEFTTQAPERRFIARRIAALRDSPNGSL